MQSLEKTIAQKATLLSLKQNVCHCEFVYFSAQNAVTHSIHYDRKIDHVHIHMIVVDAILTKNMELLD